MFHDTAAVRLWFAGLITYSEALTLAGVYVPFTDIGGAVLRMLAETRGITVSAADAAEFSERFVTLPPHPQVPAAPRRLGDHGCWGSARLAQPISWRWRAGKSGRHL